MKRHAFRRLYKSIASTAWAIDPDSLHLIQEIIEHERALQADGGQSLENIHSRFMALGGNVPDIATTSLTAVIPVSGPIVHHETLMSFFGYATSIDAMSAQFKSAVNDPDVERIVLLIDSPGGTVMGLQEFAAQIRASEKPTLAVVNGMAASAAYYIASQAKEIVMTPSGLTGAVGVRMLRWDTSKADNDAGYRLEVYAVPDGKGDGYGAPTSEDGQKQNMRIVQQYYDAFVSDVAQGRGTSVDDVKANYGDGRTVSAQDAFDAGMVDRLASWNEIVGELSAGTTSGTRAACPVFDIRSIQMDKRIFEALVRLSLCKIDATEEVAQAALSGFFAARGKSVPESVDEVVAELSGRPATQPEPTSQPTAAAPQGVDAAEIIAAVRLAVGIPVADQLGFANELIAARTESGQPLSMRDIMQRIQDKQAEYAQAQDPGQGRIEQTEAEIDKFQSAVRDTILVQANVRPGQIFDVQSQQDIEWTPQSTRNYALRSPIGIAKQCLRLAGVPQSQIDNLSNHEIASIVMGAPMRDYGIQASSDGPAYNVTGMYSNIFYDAGNVMLRRSYSEANTTYQIWARRGEAVRDFKDVHKVIAGELPDPAAIPENAEFEDIKTLDGRESYKLTVWGSMFSMTWQMVVNDQLSAFTEIPLKHGRSMRRKENKLVYNVLKDNANLADGGALFNATALSQGGVGHNNLTTGSITGSQYGAAFNTMEQKMAEMTGLNVNDRTTLNLTPEYVLMPPAIKRNVMEFLGSQSNPAAANGNSGVTNTWQGSVQPVTDAELGANAGGSDTAFYMAANPMDVDTVEYAYLQGLEAPRMERAEAFDRLALRFRMYLAFATKALDFRGLQKHTGA